MKSIAIVGAGVAGLRAALELIKEHKVSLFEKSPSVGGRIATRRFGEVMVNHGAPKFDGSEYLDGDLMGKFFLLDESFPGAATDFPKRMRDKLLENQNLSVLFQSKVLSISEDVVLTLEDGKKSSFDDVIITAPVPQVRELLGQNVLPQITYSKQILFIGEENQLPVRIEMSEQFSEKYFNESEDLIREKASQEMKRPLHSLDLKKWRYSRVLTGYQNYFFEFNPNIILAGDAFDPGEQYHLGAAWVSGLKAARKLL